MRTLAVVTRAVTLDMTMASIVAGVGGTESLLDVTVAASISGLAVALIVVQELDTVRGPVGGAGAGQTLVDVSLTPVAGVSGATLAAEAAHLVHTRASIEAGSHVAVIKILLAVLAVCSRRTGALELANQVKTRAPVMAGVASALVDVPLALGALESLGALTAVGGEQVGARGAVVTRVGAARVRLVLAVGAPEPVAAVAGVGEAGVATGAPVPAQARHGGPLAVGRHLAADLSHVTNLASPSTVARAEEACSILRASGPVLTGVAGAPVHDLVTIVSCEP